jgi:hypothetical protein
MTKFRGRDASQCWSERAHKRAGVMYVYAMGRMAVTTAQRHIVCDGCGQPAHTRIVNACVTTLSKLQGRYANNDCL